MTSDEEKLYKCELCAEECEEIDVDRVANLAEVVLDEYEEWFKLKLPDSVREKAAKAMDDFYNNGYACGGCNNVPYMKRLHQNVIDRELYIWEHDQAIKTELPVDILW